MMTRTLSLIGFISATADYKKNKWLWTNSLDLALGGMLYLDKAGKKQGLQKTPTLLMSYILILLREKHI